MRAAKELRRWHVTNILKGSRGPAENDSRFLLDVHRRDLPGREAMRTLLRERGGRPLDRRRRRRRLRARPAPRAQGLADRDPRCGAVLAPRPGLGLRRGRLASDLLEREAHHRRRGPDRARQEQLGSRRRRLDGPLRGLHTALSPLGLRDLQPRRRRRGLADLLRRAEAPLRGDRARATRRRAGLAVGGPALLPVLAAPGQRGCAGSLAGRSRQRHRDARRPRRDRQRHLRQPPPLHLPRLLPAGLQGQREGEPLRHPPAGRAGARR